LKEKENLINNLENSKEKKCMNFEVKLKEIEKENKCLKNQIRTYEEELRFLFKFSYKIISKNRKRKTDVNFEYEKKNQEYQFIIEDIKKKHLEEIHQIQKKNHLEKQHLENVIYEFQNGFAKSEADRNNLLKKDILRLNKTVNEMKKKHAEEVKN